MNDYYIIHSRSLNEFATLRCDFLESQGYSCYLPCRDLDEEGLPLEVTQQCISAIAESRNAIMIWDGGKLYGDVSDNDYMAYNQVNERWFFVIANNVKAYLDAAGWKVNQIDEYTAEAGVTIETVLIKDGEVDGTDISVHVVNASAHHAKYTDAEAISAIEAEDPLNLAGQLNMDAAKKIVFGGDTNLYRGLANFLMTDDGFIIGGDLYIQGTSGISFSSTSAHISWGDTSLKRYAANGLETPNNFKVGGNLFLTGSTNVIETNWISEVTTDQGVNIEGVVHTNYGVKCNTIIEHSLGVGVTIEGVLLKDGIVYGSVYPAADDESGSFLWDTSLYTTAETDISALFTTDLTGTKRRKYSLLLDVVNVAGDGAAFTTVTIRTKVKTDGSNYRTIRSQTYAKTDLAAGINRNILAESPVVAQDVQVTMQFDVALSGDQTIYYHYVKEELEA